MFNCYRNVFIKDLYYDEKSIKYNFFIKNKKQILVNYN